MDEDRLLIAGIEDKYRQSEERYMVTNTAFLDVRQRSAAEGFLRRNRGVRAVFWGGFAEAERCVLAFLPEYIAPEEPEAVFRENPEENPLAVLRVSRSKKSKALSHRDYLGSLMGLGLKRECIGDILTGPEGADIIVLKEVLKYLLTNYQKAGNTSLEISEISSEMLRVPERSIREKADTVASLRLDNIVASGFGISRTAAVTAIKSGLVFVNHVQTDKIDLQVREKDSLTLRGRGKILLAEIGGKSRKDRQYVKIQIYE